MPHVTFAATGPGRRLASLLAIALTAASLAGSAGAQTAFRGEAEKGAPKGQACAACHGAPARPPLPGAPTLGAQPPEYLAMQMFLFREGIRDVPPMTGVLKGVTDPELNDMAAYFAAQKPLANKRKLDAKLSARGAELATSGCGGCHMADYSGQREVPRLAGQSEDYLVASMKAYRDNKRVGTDTNMNGIMARVTDADIEALAHFLAHR